jgi:hypothetical protein
MHPSPAAIAWIQAQSPDFTKTDAAIAASLNAATVANPITVAPQIPKPFTFNDVFGLLSDASVAAIRDTPNTTDLIDKVNAGDRMGVLRWASALFKAPSKITVTEAGAVQSLLTSTVADPAWSAQIPAPLVALGRLVDSDDIAASRPGV